MVKKSFLSNSFSTEKYQLYSGRDIDNKKADMKISAFLIVIDNEVVSGTI